jgi:L-threonylcarbamoyladenylate synthase
VQAKEEGALEEAISTVRAGGLIAFPTDTVYGLAALPDDPQAVTRIYSVKGRSASNPLALLLSDSILVNRVAIIPEAARPLMRRFWPGGLTLVVLKTPEVSEEVSPGTTVGIRIPNLRLARDLIRAAGGILAVTSANRSGAPSPLTVDDVLEQLGDKIELVVDGGRCWGGVPSTVLDCTVWPPTVLRHGAVPEEAIRRTLDKTRT